MHAAIRPDNTKLRRPVAQGANCLVKTGVYMSAIVGMNMLDEDLKSPLLLGNRLEVPEALVVAQRTSRSIVDQIEVPVADRS